MNRTAPRERKSATPWYREPWPWLLMIPPAVAVVAGLATLWIASSNADALVADDYYKRGLAINQDLARGERAKALQLTAHVRFAADRAELDLGAREGVALPHGLIMTLSHPTRGGMDQPVTLSMSGNRYTGAIKPLSAGKWQVSVEDPDRTWRLAGVIRLPDETQLSLTAP